MEDKEVQDVNEAGEHADEALTPDQEPGAPATASESDAPDTADTSELDQEEVLTPIETLATPTLVPRWIQLVVLPLAILGLYELARAVGSLVVVLIGAGVISIILNPMVKVFRRRMPHGFAILLGWIVIWLVMALVIAILASPLTAQLSHISSNFPEWVRKANHSIDSIQRFLNQHGLKVHIAGQGQTALQSLEKKVLKSSGSIISVSSDVFGKLVSLSIDLVLTFVLSIYFVVYSAKIAEMVRKIMPPGDGTPEDDYPSLVQKAVSGYVRAQLLFSLIMGVSAAVLMWVMGMTGIFPDGSRFAVFFGLFYALMELIPYIGPIIGPIPPILVALATHPISALWVLIVFIVLQQLDGHLVAPQLFRIGLRINPILVILALLVGEKIFGIAGALLALPVATVIRQTVIYLRAHLVLEKWTTNPPI
jgi:putative heme transporter